MFRFGHTRLRGRTLDAERVPLWGDRIDDVGALEERLYRFYQRTRWAPCPDQSLGDVSGQMGCLRAGCGSSGAELTELRGKYSGGDGQNSRGRVVRAHGRNCAA